MKQNHKRQFGYLLPATIMLGLGIAVLSVTVLQVISSANATLTTKVYTSLAQDAAASGLEYAGGCLTDGATSWSPLTPGYNCSGRPSTNCATIKGSDNPGLLVQSSPAGEWRSFFCVTSPASNIIVSTGIVEQLRGGTIVERYKKVSKTTVSASYMMHGISHGESITDIKNDRSDCAIANGKLYCWGDNSHGQLGLGDRTDRATPTLVRGALQGKTVTKVSVAYTSVCAVADGKPYCWGDNQYMQLGDGRRTYADFPIVLHGLSHHDTLEPEEDSPITSSGPLHNKIVTDIGTASQNNPASLIWSYATAFPHSCALTADGAVSCWGDGSFRQLTGGRIAPLECHWPVMLPLPSPFPWCLPGFYNFDDNESPELIKGYRDNTGPFAGKKAERVGASSHDSCLLAHGRLYCIGVKAPLPPLCGAPGFGMAFSADFETIIPLNPCIGDFSDGYDASDISDFWTGYTMDNKFIDKSTWELSANETCMMADSDFVCFGQDPAFNALWFDGWGPPWRVSITNADVTAHDNGDSVPSGGTAGIYCIIDRGEGKCAGNFLNGYIGTGGISGAYKTFYTMAKGSPTSATDIGSKIPTTIAAGQDHGCMGANGQLLCWGQGVGGMLGDGNLGWHSKGTAQLSTTTAYTSPSSTVKFGTQGLAPGDDVFAANGSISIGNDHACGIANGRLFCWGNNGHGQLGIGSGSTATPSIPIRVTATLSGFNSITKVSAGGNHTCAIAYGDLYCWGQNNRGQLGLGDNTDRDTPQLVNLGGRRVTDVSAGADSTCAVANGQAFCWGSNTSQKLGNGTLDSATPLQVTGGSNVLTGKSVSAISAGNTHTCAIANADLYCWGSNTYQQLGHTSGSAPALVNIGGTATAPVGPNNMRPSASAVSAGNNFTCAVINGTVSCWGDNTYGQLGRGFTGSPAGQHPERPEKVIGPEGNYYATTVSAGNGHVCALLHGNSSADNGNIYCWGRGTEGQVGDGGGTNRSNPRRVDSGATIDTDIAPATRRVATNIAVGGISQNGGSSSCAVANAVIICWGQGQQGQIGNGQSVSQSLPVSIAGYREFQSYQRGPVY